jgi:hypothetical protein
MVPTWGATFAPGAACSLIVGTALIQKIVRLKV